MSWNGKTNYLKETKAEKLEKDFEESAGDWLEEITKEAEKRQEEVGEITPQCNLDDDECLSCGA